MPSPISRVGVAERYPLLGAQLNHNGVSNHVPRAREEF